MDKGHILIVDDESGILSSLEGILQDEGYRVVTADSGEQAIDLVRAEAPDVVLVDVWMPGIDGIKTLQAVKESNADTEVIVMSGHGNIDTAVTATKLGAFDFIEKPLSMENVLRVVGSAVRVRRARERTSAKQAGSLLDGNDPKIAELRARLNEAAGDVHPLVIWGERGTGKRFIAQVLHSRGVTREGAFTSIHCRAIPPAGKRGGPEAALGRLLPKEGGGTLYLDGLEQCEAGQIDRILAALHAREGIGDRLIVAIDEDRHGDADALSEEVAERIQGRRFHLPPLRERRGDILPLARRFLSESAREAGRENLDFGDGATATLFQYHWPGNIAELKSVVTRAAYAATGNLIQAGDLPAALRGGVTQQIDFERAADYKTARSDWERRFLAYHLLRNDWDVEKTGRTIGMSPSTLTRKIRAHRLEPPPRPKAAPGRAAQRTIGRSMVLYGRGLHSGLKTGLIIEPLPPGSGIRFGSLTTPETVAARVQFVEDTNHATNLRDGPVVARTIEHLMSALHAYGVSNLLVKIGEEVPIMDGSAVDFCRLIEEAGVEEQEGDLPPLEIGRPYEVGEPGSPEGYIRIEPAEDFSISYLLDYPEPIGVQTYVYEHAGQESFRREVAPARTFSFIWELESLERMGLGEGGRWGNVILVDRERVVNTELRFPDEFARHKVLDVMGDLYLVGRPIRGKVTAERSGHAQNVALVRLLTEALL